MLPIIHFTRLDCASIGSVPKGEFEGNQLLDGSMGLSPLYSDLTNDLHVSNAANLHQSFPWLHPIQA